MIICFWLPGGLRPKGWAKVHENRILQDVRLSAKRRFPPNCSEVAGGIDRQYAAGITAIRLLKTTLPGSWFCTQARP